MSKTYILYDHRAVDEDKIEGATVFMIGDSLGECIADSVQYGGGVVYSYDEEVTEKGIVLVNPQLEKVITYPQGGSKTLTDV